MTRSSAHLSQAVATTCQDAARQRRPPCSSSTREACRAAPQSTVTAASSSARRGRCGPRCLWARRAAVISALEQAASEEAAWRRRSWQLVALAAAAWRSSCSCGQPSTRSRRAARRPSPAGPAGSGVGGKAVHEGPPREVEASRPSRASASQMWNGGGRAPFAFGTVSLCSAMRVIQACLAARVRLPPCHWAGSREPSRLKPGQ